MSAPTVAEWSATHAHGHAVVTAAVLSEVVRRSVCLGCIAEMAIPMMAEDVSAPASIADEVRDLWDAFVDDATLEGDASVQAASEFADSLMWSLSKCAPDLPLDAVDVGVYMVGLDDAALEDLVGPAVYAAVGALFGWVGVDVYA